MALETALLIVPPKDVQVFSFPIREEHDSDALDQNLPAHMTLLYPFVSPEKIEPAAEKLRRVLAEVPPFEVTLDRYGQFEDALFLEPADPAPIMALYERLARAFSEFPIYEGEHGAALHPHVTLARFQDPAQADAIQLPPTPSFTFLVDKLHIYLGSIDGDEPFIPRAVIPLGGGS